MRLLNVLRVSKVYEVRRRELLPVLREINFEASSRRVVGVVGESACGKSTLGKIIAGLERPTSGEVKVMGKVVKKPGEGIVLVPQLPTLFPWMSLRDNVKFGFVSSKLSKREKEERVERCMEELGLAPYAKCHPRQVPESIKQATCIARALVSDFDLLVLDEPFANLDSYLVGRLADALYDLCETTERAALVLTKYIDRAIEVADRLVLLTPRPAEVRAILDVNLKKPRDRGKSSFRRLCKFVKHLVFDRSDRRRARQRL